MTVDPSPGHVPDAGEGPPPEGPAPDSVPTPTSTPAEPVGRRSLLGYAGVAGAGALAGGLAGAGISRAATPLPQPPVEAVIRRDYSPHETHQAGVVTPTPAVTRLVAFRLRRLSAEPLVKLLKLWSGDIQALMAGRPVPGDPTPDLARSGVSLTVTIGFGPRVFTLPGLARQRPDGFVEIPPMRHDRLQARWHGGDLLAIIAADDATTVDYAARRLVADAATFARPLWVQDGSWRGTDASGAPVTGRNLFGQLDGTGNPTGQLLDEAVWAADPLPWFTGGTTLVVRRIEMDLDFWDRTTRERQEKVIGRRLDSGAPLTGSLEADALDLAATDATGSPVIPADAHARRSHPDENSGRRFLRRGLNYTHTEVVDGVPVATSGLVFLAFCANIAKQFVPIQNRLDDGDALNDWTYAIGSAVFAIPGGFAKDDWIARALFE